MLLMAWVAALTNTLVLKFKDDTGKHASMKFNIDPSEVDPDGGAASAIGDAAAAISDSALYEREILIVAVQNTPPTFGSTPYKRAADKAAYKFSGVDGTKVHLQIGAPLALNFSNGWDIDPANSTVTAFINAMKTNAKTEGGAAIAAFSGGTRRQPPRLKKH